MAKIEVFKTGVSFQKYYLSLNSTYLHVFKKHLMLHYPFYCEMKESLEKRQSNLTNHCITLVGNLANKRVLDVGCGNGTQSIYIANQYNPIETIGIDLNPDNIDLALRQELNGNRVVFYVDDAHKLDTIANRSIDTLICIESAFHYHDKELFLKQVNRVLKQNGEFLIADILSKSYKNRFFLRKWKKKMSYHHWTEDQYKTTFLKTGLQIGKTDNITRAIIKGYKGYLKWIRMNECNSIFAYTLFQLFLLIQVNMNLILLKHRRQYLIFAGRKQYSLA
ncbi:MAG: class I SAM-dependent methyltransferase [Bacteroidales bacterium]|nr:class I SAM-dependent methyltransferase [Bacteroidales bacterium]